MTSGASCRPDVQQVFTDVSNEYVEYWAKVASALDAAGVALLMQQPGREVIDSQRKKRPNGMRPWCP